MDKPITEIIRSYHPSLTMSEQKVADYVLGHPEEVMYFSVNNLADEAKVGETTVLRFCKKVGVIGYQEFKLAIARHVAKKKYEKEDVSLKERILHTTTESLQQTAAMVENEEVEKAVQAVLQAKHVHICGVGTSGITAMDAKSRFLRIGKSVEVWTDPHFQAMAASSLNTGDVVIAISVSGSTRDTLETVKIARENGASVIAVTYFSKSPITEYADVVLTGGAQESPLEGGSMTAKICQLYVIDLICTGVALEDKKSSEDMKERTANAVVNKIY